MTAFKILTVYLEKSLWPVTLSSDYGYDQIPLVSALWDGRALVGIVGCLALCWWMVRPMPVGGRAPRAVAMIVSVAASLVLWAWLPVSNLLIPIGTNMAERLMYLPSVGLCLLLALASVNLLAPSKGAWLRRGAAGDPPSVRRLFLRRA